MRRFGVFGLRSLMTIEEEWQKILQAQTDPGAFGEIFDIYYGKIYNYCLRRAGNGQVAEDLTSEIFFKALNNLKKIRWQKVPFSAWLFKIAHNEVISYYRKGVNRTVSLEDLQGSAGFDITDGHDASEQTLTKELQNERFEMFKAVKNCLRNLPEHYREALSLKYFEKLSIAEISVILDKPEGTVKSLLSRGVDLLQDRLAGLQPTGQTSVVTNEGLN